MDSNVKQKCSCKIKQQPIVVDKVMLQFYFSKRKKAATR